MSEKIKAKIIAWSKGLTVIPFENVLAVGEDPCVDGQLIVGLTSHIEKSGRMFIKREDAQDFIDQYNIYLGKVEEITLTPRFILDNSNEVES